MSTPNPSPRHFLDIDQFDIATLRAILDKATELKKAGRGHEKPLVDHTLVLIFEKSSRRTRISFEVGMRQLGGETVMLSPIDTHLGRGETIADTTRAMLMRETGRTTWGTCMVLVTSGCAHGSQRRPLCYYHACVPCHFTWYCSGAG